MWLPQRVILKRKAWPGREEEVPSYHQGPLIESSTLDWLMNLRPRGATLSTNRHPLLLSEERLSESFTELELTASQHCLGPLAQQGPQKTGLYSSKARKTQAPDPRRDGADPAVPTHQAKPRESVRLDEVLSFSVGFSG